MRNITTPAKAVSFEDALRNLAAKLTGKPAASLPRTQEAVVQYIADNISSVKELTDALAKELAIRLTQELAEAIVQEVMERLALRAPEATQDSPADEPEGNDTPRHQRGPQGPQTQAQHRLILRKED